MNTWGVHSFENDCAVDWAAGFKSEGLPIAVDTMRFVASQQANGLMDADQAARGVAAVEAVAYTLDRGSKEANDALKGAPKVPLPDPGALLEECGRLLNAIAAEGSPLRTHWETTAAADLDEWLASIQDLRGRLAGNVAAAPVLEPQPITAAPEPAPNADELRLAIDGLQFEIETLREEMNDQFDRLSKKLEALSK